VFVTGVCPGTYLPKVGTGPAQSLQRHTAQYLILSFTKQRHLLASTYLKAKNQKTEKYSKVSRAVQGCRMPFQGSSRTGTMHQYVSLSSNPRTFGLVLCLLPKVTYAIQHGKFVISLSITFMPPNTCSSIHILAAACLVFLSFILIIRFMGIY
jgi:hypothetical protein